MKKRFNWILLVSAMVMAACDPLGFEAQPNYNGALTLANGSVLDVCNSTTWQLHAGSDSTVIGDVIVSNDDNNLYVTINSMFGFRNITNNVKLWVGTNLDLLPVSDIGTPVSGHFPFQSTVATGVHEYTFTIPWADIESYNGTVDCNSKFYVYTHADVVYDAYGNEGTGSGGYLCRQVQENVVKRWVCSGVYQAKCCTTPPPPCDGKTETAFAKGGYVFTTGKNSNHEKLASLNLTKNRWGWAINITETGTTTYEIWSGAGLNDTSKGTLVGTLTVNWDGSYATVTYTLSSGSLSGIHVYAGDFKPTTLAPGQYGNTASFDPAVTTYTNTYAVSDTNGDGIWIIAHASVAGDC